jgi:hypothetical protein
MKKDGREGKIAVVVGTITNDLRLFSVPKLTVSLIGMEVFFSTGIGETVPRLVATGCRSASTWKLESHHLTHLFTRTPETIPKSNLVLYTLLITNTLRL